VDDLETAPIPEPASEAAAEHGAAALDSTEAGPAGFEPPASAFRSAARRQLVLLGMFVLCVGLLFVLAAASGPYGAGCGGG
jgi:hypothetical protein